MYGWSIHLTKFINIFPVASTSPFTASIHIAAPAAPTVAPPKTHRLCLHAPRLIRSANVRWRVEVYVKESLRRIEPRLDMQESRERWEQVRVGDLAALVDLKARDDGG